MDLGHGGRGTLAEPLAAVTLARAGRLNPFAVAAMLDAGIDISGAGWRTAAAS